MHAYPANALAERLENRFLLSDVVQRLTTINPPVGGIITSSIHEVNGRWVGLINDTVHYYELWTSDGTVGGTHIIQDIWTGVSNPNYTPKVLGVVGDELLFSHSDVAHGKELWITDGTAAGTSFLKDLEPGSGWSSPEGFALFNGFGYFITRNPNGSGSDAIWRTDGTVDGTVKMFNAFQPTQLTVVGDKLFYLQNAVSSFGDFLVYIRVTDGISAPTSVGYIYRHAGQGQPMQTTFPMIAFDDKLYFQGRNETSGYELWVSDGTTAGTHIVKDIRQGSGSSAPDGFAVLNNELMFSANDGTLGAELYSSNGTDEGTQLVLDVYPGNQSGVGISTPLVVDQTMFFRGNDGVNGGEAWVTDGTPEGTHMIAALNNPDAFFPTEFALFRDEVYFRVSVGANEHRLYKSDANGTSAQEVVDLVPGQSNDRAGTMLRVVGDGLYFVATEPAFGTQLWRFGPAFASISNRVLTVNGGEANDAISFVPGAPAGSIAVSFEGATITFAPSDFDSIIVNAHDGNDTITISAPITQPITFSGGAGTDTIALGAGGQATLVNDVGWGSASTAITVAAGASLTLQAPQHLRSINVAGAVVVAADGAAFGASGLGIRTAGLSISGGGTLDLNDNDLILDYNAPSQMPTVQSLINSARAGGTWTGPGITSTAAKNANPRNTTLGAMEASDFKSIYGPTALFAGEAIDSTAVLVKYTYYGDADFSGAVNFDDYSRTDAGFNLGRTGWLNGDFDGNGTVNFDDYSFIDLAFNTQGSGLHSGLGVSRKR